MNGSAADPGGSRAQPYANSMPIEEIHPADPELFRSDTLWPYFERLRREDPVHYAIDPHYGPYWSITKYKDIVAVEADHQTFSSKPNIMIGDQSPELPARMFAATDPPEHTVRRDTVSPAFLPHNLASLEPIVRQRAGEILDGIAAGEEFDWVSRVSVELTSVTLAVLLDFPWEDRHKLIRWSDVATAHIHSGVIQSSEQRRAELRECLDCFQRLRDERARQLPRNDLISLLAHGAATRQMDRMDYMGDLMLLIVAGNDTTRNSISGSVVALNENPDQFSKLRANPALVPAMVSETIRWQSPIAYIRRTPTRDVELRGKRLRQGERVLLWYASANRDDEVIAEPHRFDIERLQVRRHLAFGIGIHHCLGSRLAELQLRIIWEEILKRFSAIEMTGEPRRVYSSFIRGYEYLPVRVR
jgi:cytochrome P450